MSQSSEAPETVRVTRSSTNPRRRVRTSENDTLKTTAPKRKRSKISQEVFQPRVSTEHVDAIVEEEAPPQTNGFHHHHHPHAASAAEMDVAVRGKKPATKRAMRGDGATIFTANKCYSVRLLPSTPKELRQAGVDYRGSLDKHGRALAVTREKATIWEYHAHTTSIPKLFDMPFAVKARDELPFGALVPSGGVSSTDAGLVLVSANTGKVVFYASIDRATTIGRFQEKNNGVDGTIGLYTGETVVHVASADNAGCIVLLDSGRTAQLALWDAQGKPKVTVNFLRVTEPASGSFFGSFKGLIASDYKKDVAAVHTRALKARGKMQAVSLTEGAEVLTWSLDWTGRSEYQATAQIREHLVAELRLLEIPELEGRVERLTALDFAILDKPIAGDSMELAVVGGETHQPLHLLVLLRIGGKSMRNYAVAALTLSGPEVALHHVQYITKYHGRPRRNARLIVPKPEHSAFVVFEDATVLLSTREQTVEGPEAQLSTSFVQPAPFEESIYLRQGRNFASQDVSAEFTKGGSHASCVSFVKSAGLVRYSSVDVNSLPGGAKLCAKSQIEQAVFYGTLQQGNIIDFTSASEKKYPLDEVEKAALQISDEILRADTAPQYASFISNSPPSMEQGLAAKNRALKALAGYLHRSYPSLPKSVMWQLMWDAERVAAGQQLWITFEEHVEAMRDEKKRKATLLDEVCNWFGDDHPLTIRPDLLKEDPVRRFFIGGLHLLEQLLGHVKVFISDLRTGEKDQEPENLLKLSIQVNDVWCRALDAAFAFRGENAADYGILLENITDGVLDDPVQYQDLREFWTSTEKIVYNTTQIAEPSRYFASKYFGNKVLDAAGDALAAELARANPKLVSIFCLQTQEAVNWRSSRPGQKEREIAAKLKKGYAKDRFDQLRSLADVGQAIAGMELAERWRDMRTLTFMVLGEDQYLADCLTKTDLIPAERETAKKSLIELKLRIRSYFQKFGEVWAEPFFEQMFSKAPMGAKLDHAQKEWPDALKAWLRRAEWRGKLCWINDVVSGSDFVHAGKVLQREGTKEQDVWAKKVELSMGKLAMLAAEEGGTADEIFRGGAVQPVSTTKQRHGDSISNALKIVDIQGQLDAHFLTTLIGSLDRDAEIENVMNRYSTKLEVGLTIHHALLRDGFNAVIDHKVLSIEQLVDVLTLMDLSDSTNSHGIPEGGNYLLALQAIEAASATDLEPERAEVLSALVWKRIYIYNDWNVLTKKMGRKKVDADRLDVLRDTALWHTLRNGIESQFFTSDGHGVALPSEVLGQGCREADYRYRDLNDDDLAGLVREEKIMDETLAEAVRDRGLEGLVGECMRGVEEDRLALAAEKTKLNGNGHATGHANGHANGFAGKDEDEQMF